MLPSSVRRVVAAAPASPLLSSLSPSAVRATGTTILPRARRYSSSNSKPSKPPSPNAPPKNLHAGQVASTSTAQSSRSTGEKRGRRKAKDASVAQGLLPSVPSTDKVPKEALALSAFFGLHRPISVTHSFPRTIDDETFAQIFAARSSHNSYSDVMSTLSRTVEELEQPLQSLSMEGQEDTTVSEMDGQPTQKINLKNPDGTESSVYVHLNSMSGQFVPFRPPPLPQPTSASASAAPAETGAEPAAQRRVYKAVFTLEETTDPSGDVRIVAHSPSLMEEHARLPSFGRKPIREYRQEQVEGRPTKMHAISVYRQRKLKMKKKKYKKLMKRTRNERLKLNRI